MSLIRMDFYSQILEMETTIYVCLPEPKWEVTSFAPCREGKHPVLYLLHGTSQDSSGWTRHTNIERYANEKGLAVVMPSAQLSGYANMVYGERFFDYITQELPQIVLRTFPISDKREDTYIAGLSMGGYGCAKIGLTLPEKYAAIGSLSNGNHAYMRIVGLEAKKRTDAMPNLLTDQRHKFCWGLDMGETPVGTEQDLYWLAQKNIDEGKPLPRFFHTCGTADRNLASARHMRDFFSSLPGDPYSYAYFETPFGEHTWTYWDEWVQTFMNWLLIPEE